MKSRKPSVLNEFRKITIIPTDKILVIGCGIFPSTSIIIAEELNHMVTAIDNNKKTVKIAKSYIKKTELSEKIVIEHADGVSYSVEEYDVIFLVINTWPLHLILKNISVTMKKDAKVICRGLKNDIHQIIKKENLNKTFSIKQTSKDQMFSFVKIPTTQSSVLIHK